MAKYSIENQQPKKELNFFGRNIYWIIFVSIFALAFAASNYATPPEIRAKDIKASLEKTTHEIYTTCLNKRYVQSGFDSLERYCKWKATQYGPTVHITTFSPSTPENWCKIDAKGLKNIDISTMPIGQNKILDVIIPCRLQGKELTLYGIWMVQNKTIPNKVTRENFINTLYKDIIKDNRTFHPLTDDNAIYFSLDIANLRDAGLNAASAMTTDNGFVYALHIYSESLSNTEIIRLLKQAVNHSFK